MMERKGLQAAAFVAFSLVSAAALGLQESSGDEARASLVLQSLLGLGLLLAGAARLRAVHGLNARMVQEAAALRARLAEAQASGTASAERARDDLQRAQGLLNASQALARVGAWEESFQDGARRVHWSEELFRILDEVPHAFTPQPDRLLGYIAPESRELLSAIAAGEQPGGPGVDLELVMVSARGRRFWVHFKMTTVRAGGAVARRMGLLRDITLQKTAQQAQRQAWALQRRTSEQLDLTLQGAQLALWAFDVGSGRLTLAQRWDVLGYSRVPATFDEWNTFIHPEDLESRLSSLDRYFAGETEFDDVEYRLRQPSGKWLWVRARGQVVRTTGKDQPPQYAGVVMDITTQVSAREVMRSQTQFMQTMVDGIDTGVLVTDDDAITYMNGSLRRLLGFPTQGELPVTAASELLSREEHGQELARREDLGRGIEVPVAIFQLRCMAGGHLRAVVNTSRVIWRGRPHYIATITPLSEHDMLEVQIRATQSRFEQVLITELEAQQSHIARELHDSLGSELAGLALILGGASRMLVDADPRALKQLDVARAQVKTAVEVTRALARGLTPVSETPGGFVAAIERLARDYAILRGVACKLSIDGRFDAIGADKGTHLFRIAQEALTNAVRHGKAHELELRLSRNGRQFRMLVLDDGIGFQPRQPGDSDGGLGMRSMLARARALGGRIRIQPRRGGGTEVRVTWAEPPPVAQRVGTGT